MLEQPESQIGISDPSLLELKNTKSEKQLAQHIADLEVGLSEFKLDETNAYGATTHEYKNWSWNDILAKMPTEMDATHRTRLEQTESFDDLISYVKNNHIYIIDRYPEYSEHVVKRLLFAREFGWVNLLPEQLDCAKRYAIYYHKRAK